MALYGRYAAVMNHIVLGPEAAKNARQRMAEARFAVPEIQRMQGATALFMKDPDGIRFEVTPNPRGVAVVR